AQETVSVINVTFKPDRVVSYVERSSKGRFLTVHLRDLMKIVISAGAGNDIYAILVVCTLSCKPLVIVNVTGKYEVRMYATSGDCFVQSIMDSRTAGMMIVCGIHRVMHGDHNRLLVFAGISQFTLEPGLLILADDTARRHIRV